MRDAHFLDLVAQCGFDFLGQRLEFVGNFFLRFFLVFIIERTQIEIALGHRLKFLAVEFLELAQPPFIHTLGQQQHLDTFFLEHFQMRAVFCRSKTIGSDNINFFLPRLHARNVIGK